MKTQNQYEAGFGNQSTGKYVWPNMKNIYKGKNIGSKECKLSKSVIYWDVTQIIKKEIGVSQNQSKKDLMTGKGYFEDWLIAKV